MSMNIDYDPNDYTKTKQQFERYLEKYPRILDRIVPKIPIDDINNIIDKGPNIIVINHPGLGRDGLGLARAYDRHLHFVVAKYLFSQEATVKEVVPFLEDLRKNNVLAKGFFSIVKMIPLVNRVVPYITDKINSLEMIPIDLDYNKDIERKAESLREVTKNIKNYLKKDKAVVVFQFHKSTFKHKGVEEKKKSQHHDYLPKFNNTVSKIVGELYQENIDVPVTPVAFYSGSRWNPFSSTVMRIGESIYFGSCAKFEDPVQEFTDSLEERIATLLIDSGIPKHISGKKTHNLYK